MVAAIMEGHKTMTRRICNAQPPADAIKFIQSDIDPQFFEVWQPDIEVEEACSLLIKCPYGSIGDVLWVRETFLRFTDDSLQDAFLYKADYNDPEYWSWKPSIHMPRAAARILLIITDIRVERLHDITRGDCMAEGCPFPNIAAGPDPRLWFADLWESINVKGSWERNPWVWVVSFKGIEKINQS